MALAVVFLLQGQYGLFYSTLCFRAWIRFINGRRRWKAFAQWADDPGDEVPFRVFYGLRRIARIKLFRGLAVRDRGFFPHRVRISLHQTLRVIQDLAEQSAVGHREHWRFETGPEDPPTFSSGALTRAILARLHQAKHYVLYSEQQKIDGHKPGFQRIRTRNELTTAVEHNNRIMHKRMFVKMSRDLPTLGAIEAHFRALDAEKTL
jgi:hypothetical protein